MVFMYYFKKIRLLLDQTSFGDRKQNRMKAITPIDFFPQYKVTMRFKLP